MNVMFYFVFEFVCLCLYACVFVGELVCVGLCCSVCL